MMPSVKEKTPTDVEQIKVVVCCRERNKLQRGCANAECTEGASTSSSGAEQNPDDPSNAPCMELNCEEGKVTISDWFESKNEKIFHFSHVFNNDTKQEVYNKCCADVVQSAILGGSSTIIVYGTSRSGKSETLQGSPDGPDKGVVQLASQQIFTAVSKLDQQGEKKICFFFLFTRGIWGFSSLFWRREVVLGGGGIGKILPTSALISAG